MRLTERGRRTRTAVVAVAAVAVVGLAGTLAVRALTGPVVVSERCTAAVDGEQHVLAPDQAANAALITGIALRRGLPARAATIALATAVQESKLRNIDYGDRDSLGLFQQRPSQGWGTPEQVMDPVYATNAFYDVLVEIEGYEALEITDAAQRVQRSGFPTAYADHEPEGRAFASALTGFSPAGLTCRLRPASGVEPQERSGGALLPRAQELADELAAQLPVQPAAADAAPGDSVQVDVPDGEAGRRLGWAAAHWAVARAQAHDVVAVTFDGRRWDRSRPDDGWAEHEDAGGPLLVQVATGG